MNKRIEIKAKYIQQTLSFKSYPRYVDAPYIDVILKNPETNERDLNWNRFLLDTGASISILNQKYTSFLSKMTPCDHIDIVYGAGGSKPCPVYKVVLIMGGKEVEIKAAHDTRCQFLILGHFDFFEKLSYTIFDSTNRHTRLVKL